jgi:hypothetical protein
MLGGYWKNLAHAQPMKIIGEICLLLRVGLIDRQEQRLAAANKNAGKLEIGGREFRSAIDHHNDRIGFLKGDLRLTEDFRGDEILVVGKDSAGIYNAQAPAAPLSLAIKTIPRDARLVTDDGSPRAHQPVE